MFCFPIAAYDVRATPRGPTDLELLVVGLERLGVELVLLERVDERLEAADLLEVRAVLALQRRVLLQQLLGAPRRRLFPVNNNTTVATSAQRSEPAATAPWRAATPPASCQQQNNSSNKCTEV